MSNDATYVDQGLPTINAAWLNDVGAAVWGAIGTGRNGTPPVTHADVLTNLGGASLAQLSASNGSTLVGYLQSGTGAVARTSASKVSDIVSVKDFGAVGDGVTNDSVAIQATITAVNGGIAYFPQSTSSYVSNSTINLTIGGSVLQGQNRQTFLYQATHNADFISVQAGNCRIQSLGFNAGAYGASQHWCINANSASDGLRIFDVSSISCHSFVNFLGVNLRMLMFDVLNLQVTTGVGIQINNANATLIIEHGQIGNNVGNQANGGIVMVAATSVQLIGINLFKMGNALWLSPTAAATVGNIYAIGCFFDTSVIGLFADGSAAGAQVSSVDFVGCWFNGHSSYGVRLKGTIKGISFTGCQFGSNTLDGLEVDGSAAVQDLMITGSRAFANGASGIHIGANVNLFHLVGNVCGPFTGSGGNTGNGILVDAGTGNNYTIIDNDVHGNTGGSISNLATGTSCIVTNNLGNAASQTAAITVTASPFSYTAGSSPETIYINTGTVSAVSVEGVTVYSQTNVTVRLRPKQTTIVTYTVAPGMTKTIEG